MGTEARCVLCQADFRADAMIGNKCGLCNEAHPDANSLDDIKQDNKERARLLNEPVIREIIYEILEEAGLKRKLCVQCSQRFFPKSAAQKFCSVQCKDVHAKGDK